VYEAIAPVSPALALPMHYRSRLINSEHFMSMETVAGEPNADTHIELLQQAQGLGLYRLSPGSGRKHQLRAQLNALGIPILHDRIYPVLAPEQPLEESPDFSQPLQLLARQLSFHDPVTRQDRCFVSRLSLNWR
jgi:tRNA pseudouridine32 synthase / 23S rRNA pseudouridine746 synthase